MLFTTAVVGAGTILFFAPPIWSLFDFAAGIVAIIAARKSSPAVEAKPAAP